MMKSLLSLILSSLLLTIPYEALCQRPDFVNLSIRTNTGMPLRYFYRDVEVLDNRVDSIIFREQENLKTIRMVMLREPASIAVADYIRGRTAHLEKNSESLLINITELRVPNKSILRTNAVSRNPEYIRGYIFFSADVYTANDTVAYKKLFSIHRRPYTYTLVKDKIRDIIDDLVELTEQVAMNRAGKKGTETSAYKSYKRDSCFTEFTGTELYTKAQIRQTKVQQWQGVPVVNNIPSASSCIYPLFLDFRNNNCVELPLTITTVGNDSLFEIDPVMSDSNRSALHPYAVAYKGDLYIKVVKNYYTRMRKENGFLYFTVPFNLPDMYQLLSFESVKSKRTYHISPYTQLYTNTTTAGSASTSAIIDFIEIVNKEGKLSRIKNAAYSPAHRNCIIDLDSGDFIYD